MYLKIQQKLHCLGCISKQTRDPSWRKQGWIPRRTISWWKASLPPQKESWAFFWTFSFHFLSFNGVFLALKCRTLVLKHLHGDRAPAICWKWISVTKVSKYGESKYTRALNASYVSTPYEFLLLFINFSNTSPKEGRTEMILYTVITKLFLFSTFCSL